MMDARTLLLALSLCAAPAAAWSDAVVLSSTAPGMSVGRVLADSDVVRLPEATLTTLLMADGRLLKLRGPAEGRPAELAGGEQVASAAGEGGWSGLDLSALGGTRGQLAAMPDLSAETLAVDLHQAGTWCVGPSTKLTVANDGQLRDPRTGRSVRLTAGQSWPQDWPVADGATYLAQGAAGTMPLRFRTVENPTAFRMAEAGCLAQAGPALREAGQRVTPFSLHLSTDRGQTPRYAIGEKVTLVMQSNRPAHLACALIKNGTATPLFPSGWIDIADHQELRVPGDRVAVEVAATPPPGMGELRCRAVAASAQVALPPADRMENLDAALPDTQLASSHLFIRVQ